MSDREQIVYMQTRIIDMAAQRWNMPLDKVSALFSKFKILEIIEDNFELYHTTGDEYVFNDVENILKAKGVALND